jgi:myosin heavy subunit
MLEGKNQSILISGESGAGKTECAKQCFSFLAEHAGSDSNVEQLILAANPLLEALGNAKTLRNNNSSRFGKWVEIDFDFNGKIVSAKAQSFLLEKIRVTNPASGERNFHIFYQLFSSPRHRKKYGLGDDPAKFRYLAKSDCYVADGIDDVAQFEETQRAATALGFTSEDQSNIFDTIAGILHLSTIKFVKDGEGCKVKSSKRLERSAKLLKLSVDELEKAICT